MWDRISATACLAATLPIILIDTWILVPWAVLTVIWVYRDHHQTHRWTEVQVATLTDADKHEIARLVSVEIHQTDTQ